MTFEDASAPGSEPQDRLLESSSLSLQRMPMLSIIFERLATACTESMRHQSASAIFFNVNEIRGSRIEDSLSYFEQNGIAAIFHAPQWDNSIVIAVDRAFIYATVEALLGGDGSEPETTSERAFSTIEMQITRNLLDNVARAFEQAFSIVTPIGLKLDRIETRMDFATIGRRNSMAVDGSIGIQTINRAGHMSLIIPHEIISSLRKDLVRPIAFDARARDPAWANHMQREVKKTAMAIDVILDQFQMTLHEVNCFRVGQVLKLPALTVTDVTVVSHERNLFHGTLGNENGRYTIRIDQVATEESETLDDILAS